ncbi:MAG TPA: hypothetical protein VHE53_01090 [Patescibacteria group bacterium]|nr:hypothetical protein [Patescibacteria group bacterium]
MKKLIPVLLLLIVSCQLLFAENAFAQEKAFSLGIYPPISEISTNPPGPIDSTITIQNQSDNDQKINVQYKPFEANNDGSIKYIPDDQIQAPYKQIFSSIKILDGEDEVSQISLKPFEAKNLTAHFDLNKDTPRGEYYFSIIFMSSNSEQLSNSGSAIPGGIATNILLTVGEKGPSTAKIVKLVTPSFLSHGPVPITLLVENTSKHFITPTGRISIYDMFGKEIGREEVLPQYILPDASRYLIDENQASPSASLIEDLGKVNYHNPIIMWPEKFLFGIYTIKAVIRTSTTGQTLQAQTTLIALPVYIFFALSFFIFILAGIYLRLRKKI